VFTGLPRLLERGEPLEEFLAQGKEEATSLGQGYQRLEQILGRAETEN
jgi:flagellum-specific ATP synthase